MLQTPNRTDNSINHSINQEATPPEIRLPIVSLADVVDFIRRRLSIILLTGLMTSGLALLYLIFAVPTFTAEADLVIESKASLGDAASVSTVVESQIGIIRSESIARAVIRKLDLTEDPEFVGRIGVVRGMIGSIAQLLGWSKPETESSLIQHALESFQRKLSVKRVGLTYIVGMSFDSIDAERAAQILNTVAEAYIAHQMDAKYKFTLQDETWIKDRLSELSSKASSAQKAWEDYYKNRKDIAGSADTVDELVAAAESSTSAYNDFRHVLRQMEATRQQSLPVFEASLVSKASPPLRASSPKGRIVLGASIIAGLLLGIAIGVLRDLSDQGIRAGAQVWKELQIACIAVVPRVKSDGVWRRLKAVFSGLAQKLPMNSASAESPVIAMRNGLASITMPSTDGERISKRALSNPTSTDDPRSQNIVRTESPIWTITDAPQSPFTESFLEIKLAIDSMNRSGKRVQVIGITSTRPNEGKSTVAAALALLMAHTGARVILLDCNLRNRSLSTELAPTAASGILDVMTGAVSLSATTWTDPLSRLAFLPAGNSSRPIYASDVLTSETLGELFQALRKTYEYVIVDLPTVTPFADVRAAAHLLDSFILVAEWGRTNIGVVERALNVCSDIDEIMLGVVLNKAERRC
jgi:capsular exopolysaccharide synthesis family protein